MTETKELGVITCKNASEQKCSWQNRLPFSSNLRNLRNLRFKFRI